MTNSLEQNENDRIPNSIRAILDEYYEASKLNSDANEDDQSYDSSEAAQAADLILSQLEEEDEKVKKNEEDCKLKQNVCKAKAFPKHDYECKSECDTNIEKTDAFQCSNNGTNISKDSTLDHAPTIAPEVEMNDKVEMNSTRQAKPTMPFLRKGSRKEPSALHRFRQDKNEMKREIGNSQDGNSNTEKETLQELEKMQEQQRENLQKRMEKRRQAREEIRKRSSGGRGAALDTKVKTSNGNQVELCNMNNDDSVTVTSDADSTTDGDLTESSDSDGASIIKATNFSLKTTEPFSNTYKRTKMAESKRQNDVQKRKISAHRSPNKAINKQSKKIQKHKESAENDIGPKELEEQWHVIKCMRKRQESALRDAEKEREEARSWAAQERQKIQTWCENQRKAIEKERQRVTNNAMVCQRKKRQEQLEEEAKEAAAFSTKKAKEEITTLKESLNKQKIESDAAKSRQRLNEKRLRDMISDREKQIASVTEELQAIELKNSSLLEQKEVFLSRIKELERKIKKKSKKKNCSHENAQVDPMEESTFDEGARKSSNNDRSDENENDSSDQTNTMHTTQMDEADEDEYPDKETARAITENMDLVQDTTESWLRNHLDRIYNNGNITNDDVNNSIDNDHFRTPTKVKPYDPSRYKTKKSQNDSTVERNNTLHTPNRMDKDVLAYSTVRKGHGVSSTRRVVTYSNGTQKEILPDGTKICRFENGDIKTTYANIGIVVYYYAKSQTSHTTHADGLEVFEFSSGQVERHFPNGEKEVVFPDGTKQYFYSNGTSEVSYPDGINVLDESSQKQILNF